MQLPSRSFYDVLGVSPQASQQELREAFLLRSKVVHPDRFDPKTQPAEWQLANELLRELNEAYSALRDPATRASYEHKRSAPRPASTAPRTFVRAAARVARRQVRPQLAAGHAWLRELPRTVQQRLRAREADGIQPQVRVAFGSGWRRMLQSPLRKPRRLSLKHNLYVTPLYLIYTKSREVWYWPITEIRELIECDRALPLPSRLSKALFIFAGAEWETPPLRHDSFLHIQEALQRFQRKANVALRQRDAAYFESEDDFRDLALRTT